MCGVIGYAPLSHEVTQETSLDLHLGRMKFYAALVRESLARGTHAVGSYQPGVGLDKTDDWRNFQKVFDTSLPLIAHTRYSTSGDWRRPENNQPIVVDASDWMPLMTGPIAREMPKDLTIVDGPTMRRTPYLIALAFNGVIHMGTREEFEREHGVKCDSDNDGEVFLRRLENEEPDTMILGEQWSFAGCWIVGKRLFAGRNRRRPLYRVDHLGARWYASTADIIRRAGGPPGELVAEGVEWV